MDSIKDRNGMDLTEAEDIKKRWQEYTEELYKKDLLEKEMATHSRILAWRILWTEEPGRLQSGVARVRHDLATKPTNQTEMKDLKQSFLCGSIIIKLFFPLSVI